GSKPRPRPRFPLLPCLFLSHGAAPPFSPSFWQIGEKYGPVFMIHLGPRRVVVLCGYDAVKEALVDQAEEFSGRGDPSLLLGFPGVAFSSGERARQLRRFSLTTLRNFGMGKRSIEERILEEAHFLVEGPTFLSSAGAPFDPTYILSRSVSNVISSVIFGKRFDYEDQEFLSMLNNMLEIFHFTATPWGQLYDMFSGVMWFLPGPQRKVFRHLTGLGEFMARKAQASQESLDPGAPRDFMECFLVKMLQEKGSPGSEFFQKNLVATALNIFFGGTETVSTTLRYALLILLKYPEVEEKLHEEIDRVVGRNRSPKMEDRPRMPYTEAVICEIQRFTDMLPMALARRVTRDTQFRGYSIPKGTEVFPMLGSVMRDPKYFARPEVFDPQHFLDENGQFKKNSAFMPFSVGELTPPNGSPDLPAPHALPTGPGMHMVEPRAGLGGRAGVPGPERTPFLGREGAGRSTRRAWR
uniref:Uncharacterized protein n=1 Tax=Varanus komodoensis TaxID=61221 RepID=A0A8D2L772_VARKO